MDIGVVIAIIVIALFAWYVFDKAQLSPEQKADFIIERAKTTEYKTELLHVVVMKYRDPEALDALDNAEEDDFVDLEAEPDNEYDSNAVKVLLEDVHIGYLVREEACKWSNLLEYIEYAKLVDNEILDGTLLIQAAVKMPKGLTNDEYGFIALNAPERLDEVEGLPIIDELS